MGYSSITPKKAKKFIKFMEKFVNNLIKTGQVKEWMIKHGFLTKSGKLSRRYR